VLTILNADWSVILCEPWKYLNDKFYYRMNCLQIPAQDNGIWDIAYPEVEWHDDTVVLMHCQDFLNFDGHGCRELHMIEDYFGDKAHRVVVVIWEIDMQERYQGPLNLAYFPWHTFNIIKNLKHIPEAWQPKLLGPRTTRWQCLNGIPRPHRVETVKLLEDLGPGYMSLGQERSLHIFPYHPCYFGTENEDNFINLLPVYNDAEINVVTETHYEERPGIITEKSLFAFLSLQVPLFIGYRGMIRHIKSLGFDVFEDVIDISYDWLPNSQRVTEAINLNRNVLLKGIDRRHLQERLLKNQQWALSWPTRMINDYFQRCSKIRNYLTRP
jgi:hypothetical protein